MRLASLTPSNTEILAFLDRDDAIVARDEFSDWPPAVLDVPSLGPDLDIDVDELAEIDPDLVLAAESVPGMERVNEQLEARGIEHVVLAPDSLDAILADIRRVGQLVDARELADELANAAESAIADVRERTRELDRVRVYWEWWPNPPIAPGAGGWTSEVIEAAGGENVFDDRADQSVEVSLADVRQADPDVIALCWQGTLAPVQSADKVYEREGWDELRAVRERRVIERPEQLYGRPGPRIVEGVIDLVYTLHPELGDRPEPYAWLPDDIKNRLPLGGTKP